MIQIQTLPNRSQHATVNMLTLWRQLLVPYGNWGSYKASCARPG